MNGELDTIGAPNRTKTVLIAVLAGLVLVGAVTGLVLFLRSRAAGEDTGPLPPSDGGANVNQPAPGGTSPEPQTPEDVRAQTAQDVAAYFAANPSRVEGPNVAIGVERTMTAEEKAKYGFSANATVTYTYVAREDGAAPVMVITSSPASIPDADHDGLSDADEQRYRTDAAKADTDGDGLSDGDEVNYVKTDPLKVDTNGDGTPDTLTK